MNERELFGGWVHAGKLGSEPAMRAERIWSAWFSAAAAAGAQFRGWLHRIAPLGPFGWSSFLTEWSVRAFGVLGGTRVGRLRVRRAKQAGIWPKLGRLRARGSRFFPDFAEIWSS